MVLVLLCCCLIKPTHVAHRTPNIGYMAGGLFAGIWGAAEAKDTSKYQEYQLQKSFKQTQDYLACVMESQVSNAVYQIGQRMDRTFVCLEHTYT